MLTMRPAAPSTTVQSEHANTEANCSGASAYTTVSWQSDTRSVPLGKPSSPRTTVLLHTPCTSTTPPAGTQEGG